MKYAPVTLTRSTFFSYRSFPNRRDTFWYHRQSPLLAHIQSRGVSTLSNPKHPDDRPSGRRTFQPADKARDGIRSAGSLDEKPLRLNQVKTGGTMRSNFHFVVTPTADTLGTSLVLQYDDKRYLFGNVAEGTQRAFVQEPGRYFRTQTMFLTGKINWESTGGLLGHILSLADVCRARTDDANRNRPGGMREPDPRLALFGARNLEYTLATARTFVLRKNMPVDVHEVGASDAVDPDPVYQDNNIKVWAFATESREALSRKNSEEDGRGRKSPRKRSFDDMLDDADAPASAKSVVSSMFGSQWSLDKLVRVRLRDISPGGARAMFTREENKYKVYDGPRPGASPAKDVPDIDVYVRQPWPSSLVKQLEPTSPNNESVSYIVKSHTQRGKFDVKKARQHGLLVPKLYGRLTAGESIHNDKGELISPEMVLGPDRPGKCAAILHIDSVDDVDPLLENLDRRGSLLDGLDVVVWILGHGVASHPLLRAWQVRTLNVQHVVISPDLNPNRLTFDSVAESTMRLQAIDPARYTSLVCADSPQTIVSLPENVQLGDRGMRIDFDPAITIKPQTYRPAVSQASALSLLRPETLALAEQAQTRIREAESDTRAWAEKLDRADTEVIPLGTGSALPSKYRNVSATLVRVPGWGSLLLDCGENTIGQLRRIFNAKELHGVLQDLKLIWISHMHADHHLGTASVIKAWYQAVHGSVPAAAADSTIPSSGIRPDELAVVAEYGMCQWLYEYSFVEDFGFSRIAPIYSAEKTIASPRPSSPSNSTNRRSKYSLCRFRAPHEFNSRQQCWIEPEALALDRVQIALVPHCRGARAVAFTWPSTDPSNPELLPLKISYSGDCRPSARFADIGRDSTLVIHEATFEDELRDDAIAKQHSTTSEALQVAARMNARAVLLTHFSQRYQKLPNLEGVESSVRTSQKASSGETSNGASSMEASYEANSRTIGQGSSSVAKQAAGETVSYAWESKSQTVQPASIDTEIPDVDPTASVMEIGPLDAINHQARLERQQAKASSQQVEVASSQSQDRQGEQSSDVVGLQSQSSTSATLPTHPPQQQQGQRPDVPQEPTLPKIGIAFDYMRVKIRDFPQLEHFFPALIESFKDCAAVSTNNEDDENDDFGEDGKNGGKGPGGKGSGSGQDKVNRSNGKKKHDPNVKGKQDSGGKKHSPSDREVPCPSDKEIPNTGSTIAESNARPTSSSLVEGSVALDVSKLHSKISVPSQDTERSPNAASVCEALEITAAGAVQLPPTAAVTTAAVEAESNKAKGQKEAATGAEGEESKERLKIRLHERLEVEKRLAKKTSRRVNKEASLIERYGDSYQPSRERSRSLRSSLKALERLGRVERVRGVGNAEGLKSGRRQVGSVDDKAGLPPSGPPLTGPPSVGLASAGTASEQEVESEPIDNVETSLPGRQEDEQHNPPAPSKSPLYCLEHSLESRGRSRRNKGLKRHYLSPETGWVAAH